uniref:Uncharacterized protein n=1 Tax=Helicotheca tamesis TaxID=374047 RepID=A0A7S2GU73_9STRA|mmetsp:Transcript_11444/g.15868  ORF Transcript_11444/g.15868 Transcript_11444/m.15868 type:complete len:310 (+) Transcript_11444:135-1064(+)|eukprot:CAMPEP_0185739946 /NCGR_PEP_ID=MMETSP1171-20130828/36606_1 /TAXON_ID=374046 /ORGANISM="Helicotheca tamensis, Strain CCMP826" /LENGTH=309 /DNA_ID=CAMNT_0028411657 /DNA_START=86 /DNA_END=1015 /DNA_ORIENTATION=+
MSNVRRQSRRIKGLTPDDEHNSDEDETSSMPLSSTQSSVNNEEENSEDDDEEENMEEAEESEQSTNNEYDSDEDEASSMPVQSIRDIINIDSESEDGEDTEDRIRNVEKEIQELCAEALIDAQRKKADKKRKKQTYVWFVAMQEDFRNPAWTHGKNDAFLILPKKGYENFVRLQKVRHCRTWGELQDLGSDIYSKALDEYNSREGSDEDVSSMARDHPLNPYDDFGYYPLFAPLLLQEMADHVRNTKDKTHSWLDQYDNTNYNSFWGDFTPLIINSNRKDLILLEIEASNDVAEEEPGFGAMLYEEAQL